MRTALSLFLLYNMHSVLLSDVLVICIIIIILDIYVGHYINFFSLIYISLQREWQARKFFIGYEKMLLFDIKCVIIPPRKSLVLTGG